MSQRIVAIAGGTAVARVLVAERASDDTAPFSSGLYDRGMESSGDAPPAVGERPDRAGV
ncbi:hypothetical protein [Leifsonia xyli]|uniref:hypothetical protein n=1 Tax=Leifsonia xyli TaxID=1575 RepID=UPI0003F7C25B|nr:hypothetical protein [Leifsonia xyli]